MQIPCATDVASGESGRISGCELHYLRSDCLVYGGEKTPYGFVSLPASDARKRDIPGDSTSSDEIEPRSKSGGVIRSSETETKHACEGRSARRLMIVQKSSEWFG